MGIYPYDVCTSYETYASTMLPTIRNTNISQIKHKIDMKEDIEKKRKGSKEKEVSGGWVREQVMEVRAVRDAYLRANYVLSCALR